MKTIRIGRMVIAFGDDSFLDRIEWCKSSVSVWAHFHEELVLPLQAGTHHIAKNPPKGAARKRKVQPDAPL